MSKHSLPEKLEEDLGFLLWHANMIWQRQLNRDLDTVDLTHTQFAIMSALKWLLKKSIAVTQKSIANRSNTDTMMVSKVLRKLEKKGLIERREHEVDTRAKSVFMTPKGEETLHKALNIVSASNNAFFSNLSDKTSFCKELQQLIQLNKII